MEKIDAFKAFIRTYPGLKEEVRNGKATWQNLYEEWYLYGTDDGQWDRYRLSESVTNPSPGTADQKVDNLNGIEVMTQAFEYLQNMDIDKVQKTMGTVQQFIQIFQTMQGGKAGAVGAATGIATNRSRQNYSGFFSQFDD